MFVEHIISSLECNDRLSVTHLGRSPKHVLLLHEADATVMFIDSLILGLQKRGWSLVSPIEAYRDPVYRAKPKNTFSGYGLIAQLVYEKTGKKEVCYDYKAMLKQLKNILNI